MVQDRLATRLQNTINFCQVISKYHVVKMNHCIVTEQSRNRITFDFTQVKPAIHNK